MRTPKAFLPAKRPFSHKEPFLRPKGSGKLLLPILRMEEVCQQRSPKWLGNASMEKRDRDLNVVQTLRDRQTLHKILERKAELAVRGEKIALQRFFKAGADVQVTHWEKRDSDIAPYEINQELESQRLQLQQANQWVDQAQRDKTSLYGELEMRDRLFRENQAKDGKEIEELRIICCEETDRARQARSDVLCMHQERNPTTLSQLLRKFLFAL